MWHEFIIFITYKLLYRMQIMEKVSSYSFVCKFSSNTECLRFVNCYCLFTKFILSIIRNMDYENSRNSIIFGCLMAYIIFLHACKEAFVYTHVMQNQFIFFIFFHLLRESSIHYLYLIHISHTNLESHF